MVCSCVWQLLCSDSDPGPEVAESFWTGYDSGVGACLKKIASCGTGYLAHSQTGGDTPDVLQQPRKIRPQTHVLYNQNRTMAVLCLWKKNQFLVNSGAVQLCLIMVRNCKLKLWVPCNCVESDKPTAKKLYSFFVLHQIDGFGGLVVSMLASGTQVCGFKPGRSRWIFTGVKILSTPSSGGEVKESVPCPSFAACKRT